jgi:TonB-dependent receptor
MIILSSISSGTDWLGRDDGLRSIPDLLSDPDKELPSPNAARRDAELAQELDNASKAFNTEMSPVAKEAPLNQSYSISIGDQASLFGNPLGYSASLSYSRNYKFYEDGQVGRWQLSGDVESSDELNNYLLFNDSKGTDEVLWGGLANIAYKPMPEHDLNARFLYTQSGESTARYQFGDWSDQLGDGPVYETRSLLYTERKLQSFQLGGEHFFKSVLGINAKWNASYSTTEQDEPDLRFFSSDYQIEDGDTTYAINKNSYNEPTRFFRNLEENNFNTNFDFSIPFGQWNGLSSKIKFGGSYIDVDRDFNERRFELRSSRSNYLGDEEEFFVDQTGIIDSTNGRYLFGNYIFDASTPRSNYTGEQTISAGYAMIELPIFRDLKFIGGARYETTKMNVLSQDTTEEAGKLDNKDLLPSVNLVYQLSPTMNFRVSYGKTLARPSFRELAPFRSFEFLGDFQFIGNPNLERTLIDNFDFRWEWFTRPGELYAFSFFYKKFKNPIERAFNPTTELVNYKNVDEGITYGAEFEIRHRLDVIHSYLSDFSVNANLSLIHSEVDIPTEEYETLILPFDPNAETTRPLFGQSPYLVNFELSYINIESGTTASIFYNVFGKRLSEVTLGVTPDVYEQSREILDFTLSQQIGYGFKVKFSAKNILDSKIKKSIEFKDKEFIYHQYSTGRNFSLGVSFSI